MTNPLQHSLSPVEKDPNKRFEFVFKPIQTPESLLKSRDSTPDSDMSISKNLSERSIVAEVSETGLSIGEALILFNPCPGFRLQPD